MSRCTIRNDMMTEIPTHTMCREDRKEREDRKRTSIVALMTDALAT